MTPPTFHDYDPNRPTPLAVALIGAVVAVCFYVLIVGLVILL